MHSHKLSIRVAGKDYGKLIIFGTGGRHNPKAASEEY